MAAALIVSSLPGEIRAAVLRDGVIEDLLIQRDDAPVEAGDRFLAKVQRFDKGLDGAFVDLGLARPGLLPAREIEGPLPPEGSSVEVAVIRAPAADKGARVSAKRAGKSDKEAAALKAPARLAAGPGPLTALLRRSGAITLVADDAALLKALKGAAGDPDCDFVLHAEKTPLFAARQLDDEVEALLQPRADLPGGGYLLIEPVETLTAIDVNAGRHDGRGGARQALEVNLAAVPVIARQLRLRALAGLIVVDFLTMKKAEDRKAVAAALRQATAQDPEPCQVFGLSPSGLLEMTRRRGRTPLHELLCRPCGLGGCGWEKSPQTLAYEALRQLAAETSGKAAQEVKLKATPAVIEALEGRQAPALAAVEQRLGRPVALQADRLIGAYEVVLG